MTTINFQTLKFLNIQTMRILKITILLLIISNGIKAQQDTTFNYDASKQLSIADINVSGDYTYEKYILVSYSGLSIGEMINVPGKEITAAINRFWKLGYFSDVQIFADKITADSIWLNIHLKQKPKIAEINYSGVKKSEQEDLAEKTGIKKGDLVTPDLINKIIYQAKKYFSEKGFDNAQIVVNQQNNTAEAGSVNLDIVIERKEKIKVRKIIANGNNSLTINKIDKAMKKTNRPILLNFFKSKKFIKNNYDADKILLIDKYNEIGFRDAKILSDSVVRIDSNHVNIYLNIDEGKKYYFGDIIWTGNTIYPQEILSMYLNINKGDIYNLNHMNKRLFSDEDAVSTLYRDNGYLFFQIDPIESSITGDTINFEMRMFEGRPATINNVIIRGNDRVYEHVVRREIRTRPGAIYSQSDLLRSLRDLAQLQLFNEEKLYSEVEKGIKANPEDGTVDLEFNLETKSSDQFEFSAGISPQGPVLSVGVKFTNFAIQNLFKKNMYRIVPQGEGQTFSIRAQANGKYYQNYSISFLEPWLGGKRPNSLSASIYYSRVTAVSERYRNAALENASNYSYDYYNNYGYSNTEYDPNRRMHTIGMSLGIGTRLKWPDDYFSFYTELSYQHYNLKDWYEEYFGF
jgi:outer membrane protein insertion porin family